jgi:hypothetical protein
MAGVTSLVSAPLALILAVVAVVRDRRKLFGILALCVSTPAVGLIGYRLLRMFCFR